MPKNRNKKLTLYTVRNTLQQWLDKGVKVEDIDAKLFDEILYHFPAEALRFREKLSARKELTQNHIHDILNV